ncbi:MAG: hypothetical protein HRT52_00755 [Colwellia sp.]|nr:hypothetical protein [Colwellia sp.]
MTYSVHWKAILCNVFFLTTILWNFQVFAEKMPQKTYIIGYAQKSAFALDAIYRVKAMYERAGFSVDFKALPAKRALYSSNEGVVDGDVARIPSILLTYKNLRRINVVLSNLEGFAFTLNKTLAEVDDNMLKRYRVGAIRGSLWSEARLKGIDATYVTNNEILFKRLLNGHFDIILLNRTSALALLKKFAGAVSNVRRLEPSLYSSVIHHYVHKKNEDIIPRLERALSELIKEHGWE